MIKRRGKSQIKNLIPDHKPFEKKGQMNFNWSMLYIIEFSFWRLWNIALTFSKIKIIWKIYERPKFWDNKSLNFMTPSHLGVLGKSEIWM